MTVSSVVVSSSMVVGKLEARCRKDGETEVSRLIVSTLGVRLLYKGAIEGLRLKKVANHLRGGLGEEQREDGRGEAVRDDDAVDVVL